MNQAKGLSCCFVSLWRRKTGSISSAGGILKEFVRRVLIFYLKDRLEHCAQALGGRELIVPPSERSTYNDHLRRSRLNYLSPIRARQMS